VTLTPIPSSVEEAIVAPSSAMSSGRESIDASSGTIWTGVYVDRRAVYDDSDGVDAVPCAVYDDQHLAPDRSCRRRRASAPGLDHL
jgi:hypothetical protein